ncbi:hypothetical protein [Methylobacterium sp. C1]|uniref:hypothetical protein n=1 Tax=Methylobacterium sp. C1 TaxID=1479019 RepID=UPI0008D97F17|nr:hypothetical protein [Methylobacterium sp. C1]
MAEADPSRRALTDVEEAALFARDALRAARAVMSGNPAGPEGEAYLAVYVTLAAAALGQDRRISGHAPGGMQTESL